MIKLDYWVLKKFYGVVMLKDEDNQIKIERIRKKTKLFFIFDAYVHTDDFIINDICTIEHVYSFSEQYTQISIKNLSFAKFIRHSWTLGRPEFSITNPYLRIEDDDRTFSNYKVYYCDKLMYKCSKKRFAKHYNIEIVNKKCIEESIAIAMVIDMFANDNETNLS